MTGEKLEGLIAATHTPFGRDGSLRLEQVEAQARHLLGWGVRWVFVGGTTGESSSLTVEERRMLARRWMEVVKGSALRVIVHVGGNTVADARVLAADAETLGAAAVSAVAPSYFKPGSMEALVETMGAIASAAPGRPFYYYEIPALTGIGLSPSGFLEAATGRIPNLAGLKFTSGHLMEYQLCRAVGDGRYDAPFGYDEMLLAALALGATGAVGSGFNFAAPIYQRLMRNFSEGNGEAARREQLRGVRLVQVLNRYGYLAAAKVVMGMLGVEVGPPRLPLVRLTPEGERALREELEGLGYFEWL